MSSLIPSRQVTFSVTLASTLGLEAAILLQFLSDQCEELSPEHSNDKDWYRITTDRLVNRLPFWSAAQIQNIIETLRQQGVILLSSAPLLESGELRFSFNENNRASANIHQNTSAQLKPTGATVIAANWQPDHATLQLLAQNNVPANFARDQITEFIHYWMERGEPSRTWGNLFAKQVMRKWREYESQQQSRDLVHTFAWKSSSDNIPAPIGSSWQPSMDAMEILEIKAAIPKPFIEDAIAEFVHYWKERGDSANTWNTKFIAHVKHQWAEYSHTLKNERKPSTMPTDWQPSAEFFDVLRFAKIDPDFARVLVAEFVLYWRDRNELRPSWNTLFFQYVKKQWQFQHSIPSNGNTTRDRSLVEDLEDRSWLN